MLQAGVEGAAERSALVDTGLLMVGLTVVEQGGFNQAILQSCHLAVPYHI